MKNRLILWVVSILLILSMLPIYAVISAQQAEGIVECWVWTEEVVTSNPRLLAFMAATPIQTKTPAGYIERKGIKADYGKYYHELLYGGSVDTGIPSGTYKYGSSLPATFSGSDIMYHFRERDTSAPRGSADVVDAYVRISYVSPPELLCPGQVKELRWRARLWGQLDEGRSFTPQLGLWYLKNGTWQRTVLDSVQLDINNKDVTKTYKLQVPEISGDYDKIGISYSVDAGIGGEKTWIYAIRKAEEWLADPSDPDAYGPDAFIHTSDGLVEIKHRGDGDNDWKAPPANQYISWGSSIRTAPGSRARIVFKDYDGTIGVLTLGSDTEVDFVDMGELLGDGPGEDLPRVGLIEGALRWLSGKILEGWQRGSIFSVTAGTTTCGGIRGTDIIIKYMPDAGELNVFVKEGAVTLTDSTTGLEREFKSGERVSVKNGEIEDIQPLDEDTWQEAIKVNKVEVDKKAFTGLEWYFIATAAYGLTPIVWPIIMLFLTFIPFL